MPAMLPTTTVKVTRHAARRYVERVLGSDDFGELAKHKPVIEEMVRRGATLTTQQRGWLQRRGMLGRHENIAAHWFIRVWRHATVHRMAQSNYLAVCRWQDVGELVVVTVLPLTVSSEAFGRAAMEDKKVENLARHVLGVMSLMTAEQRLTFYGLLAEKYCGQCGGVDCTAHRTETPLPDGVV